MSQKTKGIVELSLDSPRIIQKPSDQAIMKIAKTSKKKTTKENNEWRSLSFLILSFLLHCLLLLGFYTFDIVFKNRDLTAKEENKKKTEIQFIDISSLDNGRLVEQAEDEKPTEKPKEARFLGKVDKVVEKETRAARHGDFQNENNQQSPPPANSPSPATSQQMQKSADTSHEKSPTANTADTMKTFESGDMIVPGEQKPVQKIKKAVTIADLRPNTMQEMSESSSVSQTPDSLKDIAIGAETNLNTKEFLYYSYFNRIKKKLRQHWEPLVHAKVREMVKRGRDLASTGSLATRLVITLDEQGQLQHVQIITTSGVEDLDDVAIDALRAAAQFPNPPKDLIREGYVTLNWDFILES